MVFPKPFQEETKGAIRTRSPRLPYGRTALKIAQGRATGSYPPRLNERNPDVSVVQPFRALAGEVTFTVTPVIPIRYGNSQSLQATETFTRGPSVATSRAATLPGFQAAAMLVNTETFDRALHHSDGPYIEIANGNGVTGMAATVKRFLVDKGFPVLRASNAAHFGFRSTRVLYRAGSLQQAWRIAKEIPGEQNFEKVDDLNSETIAIKVILGKDIRPYYRHFKGRS